MKWTEIEEDFPEEGEVVCVVGPTKDSLVCVYENDSFGLGDYDFQVTRWRHILLDDLKRLNYNRGSTAPTWGHKGAGLPARQVSLAR